MFVMLKPSFLQLCVTMDPTNSASPTPAGLTVQVCFPGARAAVMDNLNRQREEGRLCDLSIQVQGQVFRAHRCVLAACSPYFHDQVGQGVINVQYTACTNSFIYNKVAYSCQNAPHLFLYLPTGAIEECDNCFSTFSYGSNSI